MKTRRLPCVSDPRGRKSFLSPEATDARCKLGAVFCPDIENALPEEISSRESSSLLPTISLENVLGGVSALLGTGGQGSGVNERSPQTSTSRDLPLALGAEGAESLRAPLGAPRISVNRTCPICMIDLLDDDLVLVMPCDSR